MPERVPEAFLTVIADLTGWFESSRIPAIVIGGVAAAILGRPRATRDIDSLAILPEDAWPAALDSAAKHGLMPRIDEPLEFARRTRVLLLRHADYAIDIDVILGRLPFEEDVVARAQVHDLSGVSVRLPQVEDLIIMKAIAQRPHDLRDIEGLLDAHPGADVDRVLSWVREFSTAMTMPDILDGLEKLLAKRSRP